MSVIISGNDVGNRYTKYKAGRFASKVKNVGIFPINNREEIHQIVYKKKQYIVGKGSTFTGSRRYFTEEYKIAFLTSIALSNKGSDGLIISKSVIGVPVNHHKMLRDKVEKELKSLGIQKIKVDGVDYTIYIAEVTVFIEGAYPIYCDVEDDEISVIIDIGAGAVNIIEWEGEVIINKFTFEQSFNKLCKDITEFLNEKYQIGLLPTDAEQYIGAKIVKIEGVEIEVPELDEIMRGFVSEIATTIESSFNTKTCKAIYVFGGGAKATINYWKKRFKKAKLVKDCQFVNQKVYQAVAESIYLDEE